MLANSLRRGRKNTNGRLQCASRLCCTALRGGGRCGEDFRYVCDDARRGCFAVSAAGLRACCCGHGRLCRCRGIVDTATLTERQRRSPEPTAWSPPSCKLWRKNPGPSVASAVGAPDEGP